MGCAWRGQACAAVTLSLSRDHHEDIVMGFFHGMELHPPRARTRYMACRCVDSARARLARRTDLLSNPAMCDFSSKEPCLGVEGLKKRRAKWRLREARMVWAAYWFG